MRRALERAVAGDALIEVLLGALDHSRGGVAFEEVELHFAVSLRQITNNLFVQSDKPQACGSVTVGRRGRDSVRRCVSEELGCAGMLQQPEHSRAREEEAQCDDPKFFHLNSASGGRENLSCKVAEDIAL